jgi:RNA recognition motif-containing protein
MNGLPGQAFQSPPQFAPGEDDIIPNAIVIKNIPFNVKRETLLDIIVSVLLSYLAILSVMTVLTLLEKTSLNIPTPYAFNYHLDQAGAFRGLAFANFRAPEDADAVVVALNGFDVQGRKLRVEYKKVLQAGEKERIEREKALRRMRSMQLEKERHTMQTMDDFSPQGGSLFSGSQIPSSNAFSTSLYQQQTSPPQQAPPASSYLSPASAATKTSSANELDMNDPATLEIYSRILLFKDDPMRDELAFSRALTPKQRRIVHLIAQKLGVYHYSVGESEERYAVVTRIDPETNVRALPKV